MPVPLLFFWERLENLFRHDVLDADQPSIGCVRVVDHALPTGKQITTRTQIPHLMKILRAVAAKMVRLHMPCMIMGVYVKCTKMLLNALYRGEGHHCCLSRVGHHYMLGRCAHGE